MSIPNTYAMWDAARERGSGKKGAKVKKVRRDLTLSKREDGTLVFTYGTDEVLVELTPDNVYTIRRDNKYYYPTYSNIYWTVLRIRTASDMSRYKHYKQHLRVYLNGGTRWVKMDDGSYEKAQSMPFTNGLQFKDGVCINPEIAVDYKRRLNREKAAPWLKKTTVLAKVLRVAVRMNIMERVFTRCSFASVNIDDPTAEDAEIILSKGNAFGMQDWRRQRATPEQNHAALMRAAENGLADYREWLYEEHDCYEMVAVEHTNKPEGDKQ